MDIGESYFFVALPFSPRATVLACVPSPFRQEEVLSPAPVVRAAYHDAARRNVEDCHAAAYHEVFA